MNYNLYALFKWFFNSDSDIYNVVSHPFYDLNNIVLFIERVISCGKKIVYITYNESYIKHALLSMGICTQNISFSNILCSFDEKEGIDLVILDDLSGVSCLDDNYIKEYIMNLNINKKIVISMEKIFNNVLYEINSDLRLFKEPRSIQTKINLNNDMPHVVFEFIKWFMVNESKVIIITKDKESCLSVYSYIKKYSLLSNKVHNIFKFDEFSSFVNFLNSIEEKSYIYITPIDFLDEFYELMFFNENILEDFNILLFFACNEVFNYKILLNICGMGKFLTNCKNEIIFVSNYESDEIIKSKAISRSYNKRIWESGIREYWR